METDKEMTEILKQYFVSLTEGNKKNVVEMTKFLVLTQNTIVPGFFKEKSPVTVGAGKERQEIP
jgi:transcription antitermination factor NusG